MEAKKPTRKIITSPQQSLHEILEAQLEFIMATALMRKLDSEEIRLLEVMLKVYALAPTSTAPGQTGTKKLNHKELAQLIKLAKN